MRTCEYCGSADIEYTGADDGGGDYGSSVCDQWHCNACDQDFETDCIDLEELVDFEPEPEQISDDLPGEGSDISAGWEW